MLFNAFVTDLYAPLSAALLREDLQVLDFTMRCDRDAGGTGSGAAWTVEIEVPNPGLALQTGGARFMVFVAAEDGTMATAYVLARARLLPLQGDMGSLTTRVQLVCAPADIQGKLFQWARANLMTGSEFDFAYGDISFDTLESFLEARSATLDIDPATHAISLNDIITGDATIALGPSYDWNSFSMTALQPPYARARLTVTADFEQSARGITNIAGIVGPITTLNPSFMEHAARSVPGEGLLNLNLGEGWKLDRNTWNCVLTEAGPIYTGRQFKTAATDFTNFVPGGGYATLNGVVDEIATFNCWIYQPYEVWMTFEYRQPRRETLTVLVSMPVQDVVGTVAEKDLGSVALVDLQTPFYANPNLPPAPDQWGNYLFPYQPYIQVPQWSFTAGNLLGDIVDYNGVFLVCTVPRTSGYLFKNAPSAAWQTVSPGYYALQGQQAVGWAEVVPTTKAGAAPSATTAFTVTPTPIGSNAFAKATYAVSPLIRAMPDTRQAEFFTTDRGRQAIEHAILRCRAFLRKSLQAREVKATWRWEDAIQVGMRHRVATVALIGGVQQPLTGKVKLIERRWSWEGRTVDLTLGVEVGTGAGVLPPASSAGTVYSEGYFGDAYTTQNTAGFFGYLDFQYALGTTPADVPVDAYRLSDPLYSVFNQPMVANSADVQLGYAQEYGWQAIDPRDAITDHPTTLSVTMRPINSTGTIERGVDVAATIGVSPRGIDLSTPGGQP